MVSRYFPAGIGPETRERRGPPYARVQSCCTCAARPAVVPLPVVHRSPSAARRALLLSVPLPSAAVAAGPSVGLVLWDVVARLLCGHGLRVSEALRIDAAALATPGRIAIRSSKGSRDRELVDNELAAVLAVVLGSSAGPLSQLVTYQDIYAAADAVGMTYRPAGAQRRRVTHAGRARHLQSLRSAGLSDEQIAEEVGLRNVEVVTRYMT